MALVGKFKLGFVAVLESLAALPELLLRATGLTACMARWGVNY